MSLSDLTKVSYGDVYYENDDVFLYETDRHGVHYFYGHPYNSGASLMRG